MSGKNSRREYTNGEVTVIWEADICYHSGNCVRSLPQVFDPKKRPWIDINAASSEEIVKAVQNCPSGALRFRWNDDSGKSQADQESTPAEVRLRKGGPLLIKGSFSIINADGVELEQRENAAFCRCGQTSNQPFCDGTHRTADFDK